ncbi:uncharacterized protein KIAA2026 isoform X2 [Erpetoichthys calabaricus]|nr:uncharacterized protein KIAA2026 isoform X2 [Erpetoichthys calabaricus]
MEEMLGTGPANNESPGEADKEGQSTADRRDPVGCAKQIDSADCGGLREGPDALLQLSLLSAEGVQPAGLSTEPTETEQGQGNVLGSSEKTTAAAVQLLELRRLSDSDRQTAGDCPLNGSPSLRAQPQKVCAALSELACSPGFAPANKTRTCLFTGSLECDSITGDKGDAALRENGGTAKIDLELSNGLSPESGEPSDGNNDQSPPSSATSKEDLSYELQQGYRILAGFLLEKHRSIAAPFMNPSDDYEEFASRIKEPMWLRKMEEKFVRRQYVSITDFVGDFRLMLENCYRLHGVDHWLSKQAQKLEMMLEQKLTLLSRPLREKTTLAVTSKGHYGLEDEKGSLSISTRRRSAPRNLGVVATGVSESLMVQALRVEEQQRAREERRQREQEKKEAEEASAKELEEWERSLLAQACPHPMETLWEIPAIGHFLCLAQQALNLPEIIFYELERCLFMPRCSVFLAKIMTSLLSHPQRRGTLHRRPPLSYRQWEAALQQKVHGWYVFVANARDQIACAEQLGLCPLFFRVLGESSPLDEQPFHLLPFYQKVWLLKALCDWVYETQKDVQDAVLGQPIHECRESILGYDARENAYIHFPHFCGADLRIYCQSPCASPSFPLPPIRIRKHEANRQAHHFSCDSFSQTVTKQLENSYDETVASSRKDKSSDGDSKSVSSEFVEDVCVSVLKAEQPNPDLQSLETKHLENIWGEHRVVSVDDDICPDKKNRGLCEKVSDLSAVTSDHEFFITKKAKSEYGSTVDSVHQLNVKEEKECDVLPSWENSVKRDYKLHCISISELVLRQLKDNCESEKRGTVLSCTKKLEKPPSPGEILGLGAPLSPGEVRILDNDISPGAQGPCPSCSECQKDDHHHCCKVTLSVQKASPICLTLEAPKIVKVGRMRMKKKKKKKKKAKDMMRNKEQPQLIGHQPTLSTFSRFEFQHTSLLKKKVKHKKRKSDKRSLTREESSPKKRKTSPRLPAEPRFQLVCTNLDELRELISKTESELKEVESSRKKSGKWYLKKQAVKELHSTLVRLLNELLPWEPKLIKAYQRNRARLKKDFDDFRRLPDYDNFIREIITGNEAEADLSKDNFFLEASSPNQPEEMKMNHVGIEDRRLQIMDVLPGRNRLLKREAVCNDSLKISPRNSKRRQSGSTDEQITKRRVLLGAFEDQISVGQQEEGELNKLMPVVEPLATDSSKGLSTAVYQKGTTPIQALLAKNVGNKVTLISHLPAMPNVASNKVTIVPQPKPYTSSQATGTNPSLGLCRTQAESLDVPRKVTDSVISEQYLDLDQKKEHKDSQEVIILSANSLCQVLHKTDSRQHQSQVHSTSKTSSIVSPVDNIALCHHGDQGKIPVQQVAPLNDVVSRDARESTTTVSSFVKLSQHEQMASSPKTSDYNSSLSPKMLQGQSTSPNLVSRRGSSGSALSVEESETYTCKQELKTVCIRDSQSILVTTRGGNTGVVKVQTNPDGLAPGSVPSSPVFTFPPHFQALLVPKPTVSSSAVSTTVCPAALSINSKTHSLGNSVTDLSQLTSSVSVPNQSIDSNASLTLKQSKKVIMSTQKMTSNRVLPTTSLTSAQPSTQHNIINIAAGSVATLSATTLPKTSVASTQTSLPSYVTTQNVPQAESMVIDKAPLQKVIIVSSPSVISPSGSTVKVNASVSSASFHNQNLVLISSSSSTGTQPFSAPPISTNANTSVEVPAASRVVMPTVSQIRDVKIGLNIGQAIINTVPNNLQKVQVINLMPSLTAKLREETLSHNRQSNDSVPLEESSVKKMCVLPKATVFNTAASQGPLSFTGSNFVPNNNQCAVLESEKKVSHSTVITGHLASSVLIATSPLQPAAPVLPGVSVLGDSSTTQTHQIKCPLQIPGTSIGGIPPNEAVTSANTQAQSTAFLSPTTSFPKPSVSTCTASHADTGTSFRLPSSPLQFPCTASKVTPAFNSICVPKAAMNATSANVLNDSSVQQKIVINTTMPLAPGTQILINNNRFIVPPQGLGPGSHILVISGSGVTPAANTAAVPQVAAPGNLSGQKTLTTTVGSAYPPVVPPVIVNPRMLLSNIVPISNVLNKTQPLPNGNTLMQSFSTKLPSQVGMSVGRTSILPVGSNVLPTGKSTPGTQASQMTAAVAQQKMPSLTQLPESKGLPVAAVQALGGNVIKISSSAPLSITSLPSSKKTPTEDLAVTTSIAKPQTSVHPGGSVSRSLTFPTATVLPMSTSGRTQALPVATVPPIGSAFTKPLVSPMTTVPPTPSTLLIAPGLQPTAKLSDPLKMAVPFSGVSSKPMHFANSSVLLKDPPATKLMVSPEGAILNTISSPVSHFLPKPVATVMVTPSSSTEGVITAFKAVDLPSVVTDTEGPHA